MLLKNPANPATSGATLLLVGAEEDVLQAQVSGSGKGVGDGGGKRKEKDADDAEVC